MATGKIVQIAFSDKSGFNNIEAYFHEKYEFQKYKLHWNTENGYRDDYCLNANGNTPFDDSKRNFYIGSGYPDTASAIQEGATAGSLVGTNVGCVDPSGRSYSTFPDLFQIVRSSTTYNDYYMHVEVNDTALGELSVVTGEWNGYVDYVYTTYQRNKNLPTSIDGMPVQTFAAPSRRANNKNIPTARFRGWLVDGKEKPFPSNDASVVALFEFLATVQFDPNEAPGYAVKTSTRTVVPGLKGVDTIGDNPFTWDGRAFAGWEFDGKVYQPDTDMADFYKNAGFDPNDTIVLKAVWKRTTYTVRIVNDRPEAGEISIIASDGKVIASESNGVASFESSEDGASYSVVYRSAGNFFAPLGIDGNKAYSFTMKIGEDLEKTFEWRELKLFSLYIADGVDASVSPPSDRDGKWLEDGVVSISVTPPEGHYFSSYSISDDVSGNVIVTEKAPEDGVVRATMTTDITFSATFKPKSFHVGASVDEASTSAGSASVTIDGQLPAELTEYGKIAVFTAQPSDGYSFVGWFDGDENVSTSATYERVVDGDLDLVARFACNVTFSIEYEHNAGGDEPNRDASIVVDGEVVDGMVALELGKTHSYEVVTGPSWFFCNFMIDEDIVAMEASGDISPSAPVSYSVKVTSKKVVNTLSVFTYGKDGETELVSGYVQIPPTPLNPAITSEVDVSRPSGVGLQSASLAYEFKYTGTQRVKVRAADECGGKPFGFFAKKGETEWEIISYSQEISILLNKNTEIYACYGSQSNVAVSIDYASGCDRTMGTIFIDGDKGPGSKYVMQLDSIPLSVKNGNGYVFVGWYKTKDVFGSPALSGNESKLKVVGETKLYAYFEKDRHAVYCWEGSSENKMMEWRSKLYVAPRPFSPSAARVDSTGYGPLKELAVEMFSAPDTRSTSTMKIDNMMSQSPRRLPCVRPERCVQVCVKNDAEVDMVAVDTSMGGLLS